MCYSALPLKSGLKRVSEWVKPVIIKFAFKEVIKHKFSKHFLSMLQTNGICKMLE